jgi:hypothetical protein
LTAGPTVLWRRRDLEQVALEMHGRGHRMEALDFDPGSGRYDVEINETPFVLDGRPHLKIRLEGHATTSFGMIVERDGLLRPSAERVPGRRPSRLRRLLLLGS